MDIKPDYVTLVPERREEITTEGGVRYRRTNSSDDRCSNHPTGSRIPVSLFINANPEQIAASAQVGAKFIELHTGCYAEAKGEDQVRELGILAEGCQRALEAGLRVNAGHGLTYWNVYAVAALEGMEELNIGHTIISRAVLVGLERAVREMKQAIFGQL